MSEQSSQQIEQMELYRCKECGKVSVSLGWLHGHIEKHRPIWRFWQSGQTGFLNDRTEVIQITDYEVHDL